MQSPAWASAPPATATTPASASHTGRLPSSLPSRRFTKGPLLSFSGIVIEYPPGTTAVEVTIAPRIGPIVGQLDSNVGANVLNQGDAPPEFRPAFRKFTQDEKK